MENNIILIENENDIKCETKEQTVKILLGDDYYNLSEEEKTERMEIRAIANSLNNPKVRIIKKGEYIDSIDSLENTFVIYDEITYIYSLLLTNNITMLEKTKEEIFTKGLDKTELTKNYIIVNNFAKELLEKYLTTKK